MSDVGAPPRPAEPLGGDGTKSSWRMAEQYFQQHDVEVDTQPHNDGYVMTIRIDDRTRRVFFDPAGRITHTLTGR